MIFFYFNVLESRSTYKVEGFPYPENTRKKDDAKTSYFELVPAEASLKDRKHTTAV